METFGEYLSFYINRAGISDAELARAIDVSRQTVFRWKEGMTSRPNNREDVLAIAKKLRLSAEETNNLLHAGGFRPENLSVEDEDFPQQPIQDESAEVVRSPDPVGAKLLETDPAYLWRHLLEMPIRRKWLIIAICCELVLFTLIGILMNIDYSPSSSKKPIETTPVFTSETLIVISPLSNSDISRFSDQLTKAIEREISAHRITGYRVAQLTDIITGEDEAEGLLQNAATDLVIYGEVEDGLINIRFLPEIMEAPKNGLAIKSNSDLPLVTQAVALLVLAHLSVEKDDLDQAMSLLSQAHNTLSNNSENDQLLSIISSSLEQLRNTTAKTPQ